MNKTTITKITNVIRRILLVLLLCISSLQLYADNYVYVCTGKAARKYHYNEDCPFMNGNCHGDIIPIKESEAIRMKKYKGLCKYCAKHYVPIPCSESDPPNNISQSFVEPQPQKRQTQKSPKRKSKKIDIGKFKN